MTPGEEMIGHFSHELLVGQLVGVVLRLNSTAASSQIALWHAKNTTPRFISTGIELSSGENDPFRVLEIFGIGFSPPPHLRQRVRFELVSGKLRQLIFVPDRIIKQCEMCAAMCR